MQTQQVNPYLFLLLKSLIEWEAKLYHNTPFIIIEDIKTYALELKTVYEFEGNAMASYTFSENLRKLWSSDSFTVKTDMLNYMCQLLNKLGNYKTWAEFEMEFGMYPITEIAEEYRYESFIELDDKIQGFIDAAAKTSAGIIYGSYILKPIETDTTAQTNITHHFIDAIQKKGNVVIASISNALRAHMYHPLKAPRNYFKNFSINRKLTIWDKILTLFILLAIFFSTIGIIKGIYKIIIFFSSIL